jgi:hypothetical protein
MRNGKQPRRLCHRATFKLSFIQSTMEIDESTLADELLLSFA